MAPTADQLTAPPAAPSLPPGYDPNTGTVPAASQGTAPAPSPAATPATMEATPPPRNYERVWDAIKEGIPAFNNKFEAAAHTDTGKLATGETPEMQLVTPQAAMTPKEQAENPILTETGKVAGGFTSPGNVLLLAGTSGLGAVAKTTPWAIKLVPKLAQAGFTAKALDAAYDQIPALKKAWDAGDEKGVEAALTDIVLNTAAGIAAGAYPEEASKGGKVGAIQPLEKGALPEGKVLDVEGRVVDEGKPHPIAEQPAGKLDDLGTRLPDLQTAEMRNPNVTFGRTGGPFGRAVDITHQVLRQNEAEKLPPQPKLPDTGTYPAIQTDDGGIYPDVNNEYGTHIRLAQALGIPADRIVSGGWLKDGDYEGSPRSDAGRYGEQARAQKAIAAKRAAAQPTIEHRENVATFGSGSEAPQEMSQVRLKQGDKTVGRLNYVINPATKTASVKGIAIEDPKLQGKGYAQQMYLAAADKARAAGATSLTSDLQGTTTMEAARAWDKLAAKGHPVEKIPSKPGSPGYVMDLTKPSPLPQYAQALSERGELPGQTVQIGDLGAKYVGKAPSQITTPEIEPKAAPYHPDLQKMADKYGVVNSPSGGPEASFITPDGKFIRLPAGTMHDDAIGMLTDANGDAKYSVLQGGDNRPQFINDTGAIRVRISNDKAGKTAHISVPKQGVTPEEIPAVQQAIAAAGRDGNVVMERADVTPETKDQLTMSKDFPRPGDAAQYLRQIQAHPDQHPESDLMTNERQSPLKEPYAIEITGKDGTTRTESVDAFSSKDALKTAQKKFPDATEWASVRPGARTPSTEYSVPTGKLLSTPPVTGKSARDFYGISKEDAAAEDAAATLQTMYHELGGHGMIGLKEGMTPKGILRHTNPGAPPNTRAVASWNASDLYIPGTRQFRPDKVDAVVKNFMGGPAADEVFSGAPRAANINFDYTERGSDGYQAYNALRDAGYNHDDALARMHEMVDENKEYLTKPEVSDVIKENVGVREPGLSTQYHHSPERMQNMHAEIQRRIKANGANTEDINNGAAGGGGTQDHPAVVARGEGSVSETAGQVPGEVAKTPAAEAAPEVNPHDLVERAQQALAAGDKKTAADLLAQARAALQSSELTTAEKKKTSIGFINPKGEFEGFNEFKGLTAKQMEHVADESEHSDFASNRDTTITALGKKGWVRKAGAGTYDVQKLTPTTQRAIEHDIIQDHPAKIYIEGQERLYPFSYDDFIEKYNGDLSRAMQGSAQGDKVPELMTAEKTTEPDYHKIIRDAFEGTTGHISDMKEDGDIGFLFRDGALGHIGNQYTDSTTHDIAENQVYDSVPENLQKEHTAREMMNKAGIANVHMGEDGEMNIFVSPEGSLTAEQISEIVSSARKLQSPKVIVEEDTISSQKHRIVELDHPTPATLSKQLQTTFGEGITTAEIKKPSEPWAETAGKAMAENGAFTINPRTGEIPNTGHWLEAGPELRQVSDKPSTPAEIQKFAAQPAVKKMLAKYPELQIGGYKNDAGKYELNLSASSADPEAARAVATKLDQESTWDAGGQKLNPAGGKNQKTSFPDYPMDERLRDLAPKTPGNTISTRYPTAVAATEDPLRHDLVLGPEHLENNPALTEKYAKAVQNVPGFKPPEGATAIQTVRAFIDHVKDNLKALYNQSTPEEQARNKEWYDGAHSLTKDLADRHGYTHPQTAGVTAALSPQKDWDMNVSLTKRLTDIVKNHADEKATPEMIQKGKDIVSQTQEVNPKANAALQKMLPKIKGKSLNELTDPTQRAAWVRLYDEAHNPREFEKIGPDGKPQGLRTNVDGTPTQVAWGSFNEINKALSILKDGSRENISRTLGGAHKVRSFYNNIIDPDSTRGDVTIDTHAVAAGLLRPLSGFHKEVKQNFNSPNSAVAGLKGTYPLYHAAYTEAAKELDIPHPRMLQSVVWEKIRNIFPAEFKTAENNDAINAIWKEKEDGKITADQARQRILDYAESHRPVSEGQQAGADQGQLPVRGVHGESAEGHERNRVSAGTPVEDDTSFNFGANAPEELPPTPQPKPKKMKGAVSAMSLLSGLKKAGSKPK